MNIRSFDEHDREAVIDLWQVCGLVVPQNNPHKDIDRKLQDSGKLFLVGDIDGRIVASAMAGYDGHRGWINYLAVLPSMRREGLGREMMKAVEKRLLAVGCPKINLQIRTTNQQVIEFYEAIGYSMDRVVSMGKRLEYD
ncbi:GNAT family acetyltransferase [Aurantivibrio plasticivorans]